ncbi:MAG TPA: Spy/CpxP family protein refolding chaperone [Verrucomicrobiae bacterium]|jgi:Spy/CpxP family protein refolding chaperone
MVAKLTAIFAVTLVVQLSAADAAKKAQRRAAVEAAGGNVPATFEQMLTDDQRQQIREFMLGQGTDFRENLQKLAQLRRELQEAALNGKADEQFIKEKTEAIAKLDAEQLRVRTLALVKVAASLTPEQRQKIKEMGDRLRTERPGLGGRLRDKEIPRKGDPAAPPPPEK